MQSQCRSWLLRLAGSGSVGRLQPCLGQRWTRWTAPVRHAPILARLRDGTFVRKWRTGGDLGDAHRVFPALRRGCGAPGAYGRSVAMAENPATGPAKYSPGASLG